MKDCPRCTAQEREIRRLHDFTMQVASRLAAAAEVLANRAEKRSGSRLMMDGQEALMRATRLVCEGKE